VASKKKKRPTPPPRPVSKPPRPAGRARGPSNREQALAAAQTRKREALRRRLVIGALLLAALVAVGAYLLTERRSADELRQALTSGSCEVDTDSDEISGGDGHVASPAYEVDPPAGGDHLASVARGGVYAGEQVPPDGELVHALEHGYVVAWHSPDLPAEQLEQLQSFEQRHDGDVIVAERASLSTPVAATAWGQRLLCGEVEPDALDRFAEEHVGGGPEGGVVERG
jgi:hypothetical protein